MTESELTESDLTESDLTEFLLDRFFVVFLAVENSSAAFDSMPNKPTPLPLPPREILIKSGVRREGRSSAHIYEEWQYSCTLLRERG